MKLLETLDWDIEVKALECDGEIIPHYQVLKRSDTGALLHVSKDSYHPTTNRRLKEIMQIMCDITGFTIEGYAEFSDGKKVIGYLRCDTVVIGKHEMQNFLVIGNSHDGTQTTYIALATIYGPNENAFSKILKHKIPHTVNADKYLKEFDTKMTDFKQLKVGLHQKLEQWNNIELDENQIDYLTKKVLEINPKIKIENVSTRRKNIYHHIRECVDKESLHIGNNLLGWFNGVTFYTTHDRSSKEKVFGNVIGSTSYFNEVAFNVANKFASDLI